MYNLVGVHVIHYIAIYPLDEVIRSLNNHRSQMPKVAGSNERQMYSQATCLIKDFINSALPLEGF